MWSPAGTSGVDVAPGTSFAASPRAPSSRALAAAFDELGTLKTTRNSPSERSPKWRWRIVRARSESVPGTVKVFESRSLRRDDE